MVATLRQLPALQAHKHGAERLRKIRARLVSHTVLQLVGVPDRLWRQRTSPQREQFLNLREGLAGQYTVAGSSERFRLAGSQPSKSRQSRGSGSSPRAAQRGMPRTSSADLQDRCSRLPQHDERSSTFPICVRTRRMCTYLAPEQIVVVCAKPPRAIGVGSISHWLVTPGRSTNPVDTTLIDLRMQPLKQMLAAIAVTQVPDRYREYPNDEVVPVFPDLGTNRAPTYRCESTQLA